MKHWPAPAGRILSPKQYRALLEMGTRFFVKGLFWEASPLRAGALGTCCFLCNLLEVDQPTAGSCRGGWFWSRCTPGDKQ